MGLKPVVKGQCLRIELFVNMIAQIDGNGGIAQGKYKKIVLRVHSWISVRENKLRFFNKVTPPLVYKLITSRGCKYINN